MKNLTIGQRLALLFTSGFLVSGMIVQAIVFFRLNQRLEPARSDEERAERAADLGLNAPATPGPFGTDDIRLPDGRTVNDVLVEAQERLRSETLSELALWSGVALVLTAIFAALLGRWLAQRALKPVERITDTTQAITASSLSTRIGWDGPQDEVAELAGTIDEMLARIESGVASRQQFAAMASHELNTPLAIIELESNMALEDPSSTTVVELAERTNTAAVRAGELVTKLLELSRSQVGLHETERLSLWECVNDALSPLLADASSRGVHVDFEPGPGDIEGDAVLIRSLAANLIENALRHNVEGGDLRVAVTKERNDGRVELHVGNTGPILDDDTLARIGRPFQQGVANPDGLGHGLGLTIARTIVDRHDGELTMTPRSAGGLDVVARFPSA